MEAGLVSDAKAHDLVLYQQLFTLQFRNLEVVGRRMSHRIGDFVFQRPMLPFKFRKMRLHGHMEWLLDRSANTPDSFSLPRGRRQVDCEFLCVAENPRFPDIAARAALDEVLRKGP